MNVFIQSKDSLTYTYAMFNMCQALLQAKRRLKCNKRKDKDLKSEETSGTRPKQRQQQMKASKLEMDWCVSGIAKSHVWVKSCKQRKQQKNMFRKLASSQIIQDLMASYKMDFL